MLIVRNENLYRELVEKSIERASKKRDTKQLNAKIK